MIPDPDLTRTLAITPSSARTPQTRSLAFPAQPARSVTVTLAVAERASLLLR